MSDSIASNLRAVSGGRIQKPPKPVVICRTCGRCRAKKVKCDGQRPACNACVISKHACIYPADERRTSRLTKAEIEALQAEITALRSGNNGQHRTSIAEESQSMGIADEGGLSTPLTSSGSPGVGQVIDPGITSPSEAELACAIAEDGRIEVHGRTSHLHRESFNQSVPSRKLSEVEQERRVQIMKDQLFAYAALQRHHESSLFFGITQHSSRTVDLDGVPSELAKHLLDLHWNRQHFAYLLTYRPAIVDSLLNGGPYCNKLLLNAIYYSSCLYSDRPVFRSSPEDPESLGWDFYLRFKQHLMDEIDTPSLPTIAALLICGTTLVSNGKGSAGWTLCGMAYRMVVDLGCHLGFQQDSNDGVPLRTATEIELRTRVYWGAFMTDKFQSLYLGRQPALLPSDARVSKTLLDYYEELEPWIPYVDPLSTPRSTHIAAYAGPRPVYAISTFQSLIPLSEIASTIVSTFYAMDSVKMSRASLFRAKSEVWAELQNWRANLSTHLMFDPARDPTPPPNQITPHATYNTLIILLERPFLRNGHLAFVVNPSTQAELNDRCIAAAYAIWYLIDSYKRAFTLRRSPYFLSYATYSAIVVMLHQKDNTSPEYIECVQGCWFALLDLMKSCTSGLRKPLTILQTMMQRFGQKIPDMDSRDGDDEMEQTNKPTAPASGEGNSFEPAVDLGLEDAENLFLQELMQQGITTGQWDGTNWADTMFTNQGLVDDSLFGLFTTAPPRVPGYNVNY